jgi:RHS repeat-associated protein
MVACSETLTAERKGKKLCARCEPYLENCGYRYDAETENYYVRNRYYSPSLGRWLTRDPIGYAGGINLYGYVNSSPVGNVDAEGMQRFTSTPVQPAPPPGSAEALLQQYSGRNSKNYPSNLPPPYDGAGGVPLGPLLAGGWHFTGLAGRELVGYTDIKTVQIDGECIRVGHPVYAPTAQIARGGDGAPDWVSVPVSALTSVFVGALVGRLTGPLGIVLGPVAGEWAGHQAYQTESGGSGPYQSRWIRVYGPKSTGREWVRVGQ